MFEAAEQMIIQMIELIPGLLFICLLFDFIGSMLFKRG